MTCKAVFFDLDDTLCHAARAWQKAEQEAFDRLMLSCYPDLTELEARRVWETVHHDLFAQLNNNELKMAEVRDLRFRKTLEALGISDLTLADELNNMLSTRRLSYMTLCDGAVETLAALRARHHVGIITNGAVDDHPDSQYSVAKKLGLLPQVDSFVVSDEVGFRKPSKEIFQYALNKAAVSAHEAVFVGDSLSKDIAGANRIGMVSILITPMADPPMPASEDERPDHVIRDLGEVVELV